MVFRCAAITQPSPTHRPLSPFCSAIAALAAQLLTDRVKLPGRSERSLVLGSGASWRSRRCTSLVPSRSTGYSEGDSSDRPCCNCRVFGNSRHGGKETLLRRWSVSPRSRASQYFPPSSKHDRGWSSTFQLRNLCLTGLLNSGVRTAVVEGFRSPHISHASDW